MHPLWYNQKHLEYKLIGKPFLVQAYSSNFESPLLFFQLLALAIFPLPNDQSNTNQTTTLASDAKCATEHLSNHFLKHYQPNVSFQSPQSVFEILPKITFGSLTWDQTPNSDESSL